MGIYKLYISSTIKKIQITFKLKKENADKPTEEIINICLSYSDRIEHIANLS
jgi:hypothetical protein